jgi:hypothetical protein
LRLVRPGEAIDRDSAREGLRAFIVHRGWDRGRRAVSSSCSAPCAM